MSWFKILKIDEIRKDWFSSRFFVKEIAGLEKFGVQIIYEGGKVNSEQVGKNLYQIAARHLSSGVEVVVPFTRADKKGKRRQESLKKKLRQAFRHRGVDITASTYAASLNERSNERSNWRRE